MRSIRPLFTEKTLNLTRAGWYTFAVDSFARKEEVAAVITKRYNVTVTDIRTVAMHGKMRRVGKKGKTVQKQNWKKAIVSLAKGQTIPVFTQITEQAQQKT